MKATLYLILLVVVVVVENNIYYIYIIVVDLRPRPLAKTLFFTMFFEPTPSRCSFP